MKVPETSRRSMALWGAFAALATVLAGPACLGNGGHDPPAAPEDVEARSEREGYEDSAEGEEDWQWQGQRQDCFFVYENECFSEMAGACNAAGCDEEECTHDDSAPAVVECPEN